MTDEEVTQKFFNIPTNVPLAVKKAAAEMKKRNDANEYIVKFAKENGYPVWDKALISYNENIRASFTGSSSYIGEGDTTVILPLVPEGLDKVTGFVTATESDSIRLDLYRGGDYSKYTFEERAGTEATADKAVLQIMALNKMVFGYTSFKVSDNRLFSNENEYNPSARPRRVTLKEAGNTQNLSIACQEYIVTVYTQVWYSDGSYIEIEMYHFSVWIGNCGPGTGSGGTSGSGIPVTGTTGGPIAGSPGTGGTGVGIPSNYPCPSTMSRNIPAMPCNGVPPPPIDPTPITPIKMPCEKVSDIFQFAGVRTGYHDLVDFSQGDTEFGIAWNNAGGQYLSGGTSNAGDVEISLVANCISYAHCHTANAEFYLFSGGDLEGIYHNLDAALVDEKIVVGLVSPSGTTYFLTIQDKPAFMQAFANFIAEEPDASERDNIYYKYFKDLDTQGQKEHAFLKFINDINAGTGLVRANSTFTEFTELKLSLDGTDVIETPCF